MNTLAAQGHYVVSYDARGHGESEWIREGEYSLSAYARDLQAIASSLTTPPALVGASLGGVASLFATGSGLVGDVAAVLLVVIRSEEGRVGKVCVSGCRSRGTAYT